MSEGDHAWLSYMALLDFFGINELNPEIGGKDVNRSLTNSLKRREFLKSTALFVGSGLTGLDFPQKVMGQSDFDPGRFIQSINEVRLYMTYYAFFEEPDDDIPPALYFDALTGQPTSELTLMPPVGQRNWFRPENDQGNMIASQANFYQPNLPYILGRGNSPDFPKLVPPPQVLGFLQSVLVPQGVPAELILPNTRQFLMALGNFMNTAPARGRLNNNIFRVIKDVAFQVQLKLGFLFQPPTGITAPSVGILLGYVTLADLHGLLGEPPPAIGGGERVTYSWRAKMELSTENQYIRQTATEPLPQGDPFDPGETEIRLEGSPVNSSGQYAIVGYAQDPIFSAPEVLLRVIFGMPTLPGIEFAVREEGFLIPT